MPSAFAILSQAIAAALLADPPVAAGLVRVERDVPLGKSEQRDVLITTLQAAGQLLTMDGSNTHWDTHVQVALRVRCAPAENAMQASDLLLQDVWPRLHALQPMSGVRTITVEPRITWDRDEADTTVAVARLMVRISHITGAALAPP
jgi:hypothetical protein